MKLITILIALSCIVAGALLTEAAQVQKPVPWARIHHKKAKYWKFYSQPRGTDLRTVTPTYHKCKAKFPENRDYVFSNVFVGNRDFEFQQFDANHIGVNCINCSPQIMGYYYSTKISNYIQCKAYEDVDI
ncbi:hypothetical protein NDA13_004702 [Ustilago tritici]|nr:hypothetical protein NDA13_004702 [Ustilago tritici]